MIQEQLNIMFWNCRGAGSKAFLRVCKNYTQEQHSDMLSIVETRVDLGKLCKSFKNLGFNGF